MSFKAISQRLMAEREQRDERDAASAREKYGSNLSGHPRFSYAKAGKRYCCTRVREIARVYREIEGLTEVCLLAFGSIDSDTLTCSLHRPEMKRGTASWRNHVDMVLPLTNAHALIKPC